jgi:hypothetical protein
MSKTSAKQRYTAFTEWHAWAKTKYPSFRVKKKKTPTPNYVDYGSNGY